MVKEVTLIWDDKNTNKNYNFFSYYTGPDVTKIYLVDTHTPK